MNTYFLLRSNMCNLKSLLLMACFLFTKSVCQDYSVTPITTSSGLYYEKIGEVLLSNSNWQFVTSVDYRGYLLFYQYLIQQSKEIETFCKTFNSTPCAERYSAVKISMNKIAEVDETMANFLGIEGNRRRVKRSWLQLAVVVAPYILEPLGKALVGKIFGDMDQQKLQEYDYHITNLYSYQKDLDYKLNSQMAMFKIDSERTNFQIKWLERSQNTLEQNIKILQGTLTADAEEKREQLNSLQTMLDETRQKLTEQKDKQNKLESEVNEIKDKLKTIDDDIKDIKKQVSTNSENINDIKIDVKINSISINFNFLLSQFESEQKILFDVIKNANRGQLDPYIITPLNLIEMLETAQSMLPENTKFPFYPNFMNAQKLYNLIKPTVYLYNNKILFILTIPVVNGKTFSLYKMTSLPVSVVEGSFIFVLPRQPYLVVDKSDQEYTMLSRENFREFCNGVNRSVYLCDQIRQTSQVRLSSDCEVTLFLNSKNISNTCNKRIMHLEKPVFLQLQEPMSWIYAVPNSEDLLVSCAHQRRTIPLKGTGFLKMNRSCSVLTSQSSLFTIARFTSTTLSSFLPHVNISDSIDLTNIHIEKGNKNYKEIISPFDYKELEGMSARYQKDSVERASLWTTPSTILSLAILLVGITALIILCVYKKFYT